MLLKLINCTAPVWRKNDTRSTIKANTLFDIYNYSSISLTSVNMLLNAFAVVIYSNRLWRRSPMSIILKYLSLWEVIFNTMILTKGISNRLVLLSSSSFSSLTDAVFYQFSMIFLQLLTIMVIICRNWTIVLLAAHRYECVCLPVGAKKYIASGNIYQIEAAIFSVGLAIALPRIFERSLQLCNQAPWTDEWKPLLNSYQWYRYLHKGLVMFLFQSGGPVLLVFILSFYILQVIRKMKKFRNRNPTTKVRSQPVGDRLILLVCLIFFILESPAFFSKILEYYLVSKNLKFADHILHLIANFCIYLDSFINFVIYIISNPTFRETSIHTLKNIAGLKKGDQPRSLSTVVH